MNRLSRCAVVLAVVGLGALGCKESSVVKGPPEVDDAKVVAGPGEVILKVPGMV